MSGYTPLFDTLTKGTLCGKWPDIGLWPIILSLSDRHGVVDMHPNAIAALTGLPVEEVTACMKRFCEPDPMSRSKEADGARLMLLDPGRDWGWRVVNHARYAEKVRLMHKNARAVESGKEAARKRKERAGNDESAGVRRCPPKSASTNSISDSISDSGEKKDAPRKRGGLDLSVLPDDLSADVLEDFLRARKQSKAPLTQTAVNRLAASLERCRAAGFTPNEAVGEAIERGWRTIKPEWLAKGQSSRTDRNLQAVNEFVEGR